MYQQKNKKRQKNKKILIPKPIKNLLSRKNNPKKVKADQQKRQNNSLRRERKMKSYKRN